MTKYIYTFTSYAEGNPLEDFIAWKGEAHPDGSGWTSPCICWWCPPCQNLFKATSYS